VLFINRFNRDIENTGRGESENALGRKLILKNFKMSSTGSAKYDVLSSTSQVQCMANTHAVIN